MLCSAQQGTRRHMEISVLLPRVTATIKAEQAARLCTEAVIGDPDLMGEVLAFYRWACCSACTYMQY